MPHVTHGPLRGHSHRFLKAMALLCLAVTLLLIGAAVIF